MRRTTRDQASRTGARFDVPRIADGRSTASSSAVANCGGLARGWDSGRLFNFGCCTTKRQDATNLETIRRLPYRRRQRDDDGVSLTIISQTDVAVRRADAIERDGRDTARDATWVSDLDQVRARAMPVLEGKG